MPDPQTRRTEREVESMPSLRVTSPSFADGGPIPKRHTADGENLSPMLTWSQSPAGTESVAVVCEDPDAPHGPFVHWLLWNLDPTRRELPEGGLMSIDMRDVGVGRNGFGDSGYGGPMPPRGDAHRYVFRVYALDTRLDLHSGAAKEDFERCIDGHILAEGRLTGKYGRS